LYLSHTYFLVSTHTTSSERTHTHTHTHTHTRSSERTHTHTLGVGVGDMAKIFYHGICNFISRLRYISRFIICRVTGFGFLKKRTLQRWRNVSTDIYLLTLKNTKVQKQYCLNRLLA